MRFWVVLILFLIAACAAKTPTGTLTSEAPLSAADEERVLADINPTLEAKAAEITKPETSIAIPDEYLDLPRKIVQEGSLVEFSNLKAVDPDGDPIVYKYSQPLNENGMWQTRKGDAGWRVITITASDGKSEVEQKILLIIEGENKPPTLYDFENINVAEGEMIQIIPKANDPDGDKLTFTYEGWISSDTYKTSFNDAGIHLVTVTVSDGIHKVSKDVKIIVGSKNRAPILDELEPVTIKEFDELVVEATATDPDGDELTFTYGAPLAPNGHWKTKKGDVGAYEALVKVSDGELEDSFTLQISVLGTNTPPVITGPNEIVVIEGDTVSLEKIAVNDPEMDEVHVTYSGWMTSLTRETSYQDAGIHTVIIIASDGKDISQHTLKITVNERNRPPVFMSEEYEN